MGVPVDAGGHGVVGGGACVEPFGDVGRVGPGARLEGWGKATERPLNPTQVARSAGRSTLAEPLDDPLGFLGGAARPLAIALGDRVVVSGSVR